MPNRYTVMNPGKYHLGTPFTYPPIHNRTYNERYLIKEIQWKTSCLLNRRMYVGNVEIKDVHNSVKVLSDSIFKSKANRFDSFTLDRRIDVAIGDGDEIIKLVSYADRLLQFKQNVLHIINATRNAEYLESTHKFKGASHPSAICETDYGIIWCNAHGVYMYNGKQVIDLLVNKGIRIMSHITWGTFYEEGETMVSYIPKTQQVLLMKGNKAATDDIGDVMVYNMIMGSFTKGTGRLDEDDKTNIVNIWDGRPAWGRATGGAVTIWPWDPDALATINNYKVETKEINFGTQAKKKVSKVRITYKGTGTNTNILPKYAINNGPFDNSFKNSAGDTITGVTELSSDGTKRYLPGSANWAEIELNTDSNANNIRSFAIQLAEGPADIVSNFEVNDITIIYRRKSIK